ncbi:UNVERIFIED_ORG: hypothetical protein QFZ59_004677 [Bacillus sp. B2I3]|nr:hypothetical protein [Bacillus sp. B2I3]
MANLKIVWITSVSGSVAHPADSALPEYQQRKIPIKKGFYSQVEEFEDVVANSIIAKKWAISFDDWENNPKRPPMLRYPQ